MIFSLFLQQQPKTKTKYSMIGKYPQYKTILSQQSSPQQQSAGHPLIYYQNRNNYLSGLSDKYAVQCRLDDMELKKNQRVGYYLGRYALVRKQKQEEDRKNNCFLDSNQFSTIFVDCIEERRTAKNNQLQQQKLRQNLNKIYLSNQITHEQPQHDIITQKNEQPVQYQTILTDYHNDRLKQKELYLLDLEIGKIQRQTEIERVVREEAKMCHNYELISKLSNQILSAYLVNFDEIYNQLIDEILTEEVYYLNYIEAEYKVEKSQWYSKGIQQNQVLYQNAKTIQMMDLVKKLDQLCDE